jgi:hypothetical protein
MRKTDLYKAFVSLNNKASIRDAFAFYAWLNGSSKDGPFFFDDERIKFHFFKKIKAFESDLQE